MASYNKVILMGNLTRDPELRQTPSGHSICKFGIGVNRRYSDKEGNTHDKPTFVDIEAWNKPGEIIEKYASKGDLILIDGRLELDQWETDDGQKRSKLKVVLENFQFMPRHTQGERQERQEEAPPKRETQQNLPDIDDDDVPF